MKIRQFTSLLQQPVALRDLPNVNLLWTRLMVEELCRQGVNTFCVAPGEVGLKSTEAYILGGCSTSPFYECQDNPV